MKNQIKNIIKISLFVGFGIFLFYLVYKDFDFDTIFNELKNLNYWWFLLMFAIGIISHISRTIRWQMLLNTQNDKTRFVNTFMAVLNGYFTNIAVPRLGEVSRCAIVSKYDRVNFSKVLGTMVSERLVDVIVLLLFTAAALILQSAQIAEFLISNPEFGSKLDIIISFPVISALVIIGIISLIFIIRIAKGKYNKMAFFAKLSTFINNFWQGIISLKNVKKPFWFAFHSILMWTMYFLMLYVCFFAFEGFENLDIYAALMLFVAGSFGMVAPAPNGMGAYHFMIIQTLLIYGIAAEKAAMFALIVHGLQTVGLIIGGITSFIVLPIINKNK